MEQQIAFFASHDGTRIGYATYGERTGFPLVFEPAWMSQESIWRFREGRHFLSALAGGRWLITFDRRGMGASDRDRVPESTEDEVADLQALVDHLGLQQFDLFSMFGALSIPLAARLSRRVRRLVLWAPAVHNPPFPASVHAMMKDSWGFYLRSAAAVVCPSGPGDWQQWCIGAIRESCSPEYLIAITSKDRDLEDDCKRVEAPTLVLGRRDIVQARASFARSCAAVIPDARLVIMDGDTQHPMFAHEDYIGVVDEFLGGAQVPERAEARALRAVLFTDLVRHTEMMSRLGDSKGRELLREHERITREALRAHGGSEIKTMGDGFMASFGSVTDAVECAIALQRRFAEHSEGADEPLRVRVGLNAGEPIEEDGDLFGATVILASRIAAKAEGGEILIADTVRGLCSGKGFLFADRGEFVAKGFEDPVRVYEVRWSFDSSADADGSG